MFIFLLTPFDAWDLYYLGLNLSQVLLIKALFINKACNVFSFLKKWRNNFTTRVCFFVSPVFIWGDIVRKVLPKAGGLEKIQKKKGGGAVCYIGGIVYRGGDSNLLHTMIWYWVDALANGSKFECKMSENVKFSSYSSCYVYENSEVMYMSI